MKRFRKGLNILEYSVGKTYFLRFTEDPQADIDHKYSRWYDSFGFSSAEAEENGLLKDQFGYYKNHAGLSGHRLDAESLTEALQDIQSGLGPSHGVWFRNVHKDNFAIFEGYATDMQDTPEGDTFIAERVVAYIINNVSSYNKWRIDNIACLTHSSYPKI